MAIVISVFLSFLAVYGFRYEVADDYLKLTNTYSFFLAAAVLLLYHDTISGISW